MSSMNTRIANGSRVGCIAAVGLALSFLGMTGCATAHYRSEAQAEQDQALALNVRDALAASPVYKYSGVHVAADRGQVKLDGVVPTTAQRDAATDIAQRVPGVASVDNDLVVGPYPGSPAVGATVPPPARPPY